MLNVIQYLSIGMKNWYKCINITWVVKPFAMFSSSVASYNLVSKNYQNFQIQKYKNKRTFQEEFILDIFLLEFRSCFSLCTNFYKFSVTESWFSLSSETLTRDIKKNLHFSIIFTSNDFLEKRNGWKLMKLNRMIEHEWMKMISEKENFL